MISKSVLVAICSISLLGCATSSIQEGKSSFNLDPERYLCASMQTSKGDIVLALDIVKAPMSTENFLGYMNEGFYDGTIFHRVIGDFMIQGGGYTETLHKKETKQPVENEAENGLKNVRGSIALARTGNPHSATSQFFINTVDNPFLNHRSKTPRGWGYAVFGKVVSGMDVVDAIGNVKTGGAGPFKKDVPSEVITIKSIKSISCE